jgi:hypothetical protein
MTVPQLTSAEIRSTLVDALQLDLLTLPRLKDEGF